MPMERERTIYGKCLDCRNANRDPDERDPMCLAPVRGSMDVGIVWTKSPTRAGGMYATVLWCRFFERRDDVGGEFA